MAQASQADKYSAQPSVHTVVRIQREMQVPDRLALRLLEGLKKFSCYLHAANGEDIFREGDSRSLEIYLATSSEHIKTKRLVGRASAMRVIAKRLFVAIFLDADLC